MFFCLLFVLEFAGIMLFILFEFVIKVSSLFGWVFDLLVMGVFLRGVWVANSRWLKSFVDLYNLPVSKVLTLK